MIVDKNYNLKMLLIIFVIYWVKRAKFWANFKTSAMYFYSCLHVLLMLYYVLKLILKINKKIIKLC